ncbi:MAG: hypothetical protein AAGF76_07540, partial [Pseudomonadota bacterium]
MEPLIVTTSVFGNNASDGLLSLGEALALAEATPGPHVIRFAEGITEITVPFRITVDQDVLLIDGDTDGDTLPDVTLVYTGFLD